MPPILLSDGTSSPVLCRSDWRNASTKRKAQYKRSSASDAALAMNEGSQAPDYASGPVWAIFDSAAVARTGWRIRYPYIADPPDGYFHKADTLAELAKKVMGHPHQKMPLKYLEETVRRYNAAAVKGVDEDFEKPVLHPIDTPPFYAASAGIRVLDSYGGLRINGAGSSIPAVRSLRWGEARWWLAAWHRQSLGPYTCCDKCGPEVIDLVGWVDASASTISSATTAFRLII